MEVSNPAPLKNYDRPTNLATKRPTDMMGQRKVTHPIITPAFPVWMPSSIDSKTKWLILSFISENICTKRNLRKNDLLCTDSSE